MNVQTTGVFVVRGGLLQPHVHTRRTVVVKISDVQPRRTQRTAPANENNRNIGILHENPHRLKVENSTNEKQYKN